MFSMFAGDSARIGITRKNNATITTAAICLPPASCGGLNALGRNANSFDIVTELGGLARIFHELLSRDREDGRATGQPSRGTAGLVPRRTSTVRRRGRHPRTPGRTIISVVAAGNS